MYVRFCKCVHSRILSENSTLGDLFREILLERCKQEFEMNRASALSEIDARENLSEEEKEEKKYVLKLRYIGHMQLIGELYKNDMVSPKIMHYCLGDLMSSNEEEKLICVCKLLQVIGKK